MQTRLAHKTAPHDPDPYVPACIRGPQRARHAGFSLVAVSVSEPVRLTLVCACLSLAFGFLRVAVLTESRLCIAKHSSGNELLTCIPLHEVFNVFLETAAGAGQGSSKNFREGHNYESQPKLSHVCMWMHARI